jgi:peptidyl-prolyl cis-trans isomerase B (cyclophilin B)
MRRSHAAPLALVLLIALALTGCDDDGGGSTTSTTAEGCEAVSQPPAKKVNLKAPPPVNRSADLTAEVDTTCGSFTIALDAKGSPKTVGSFVYLARQGVYDDTPFHRVVPDFVIQGGDPSGDGTGGPGYTVDEAPPQNTEYLQGTVAMAKSSAEPPGRSGSQFFVVLPAAVQLPPDYAILGEVSSGMETVDRIASLGTPGADGPPSTPVVINKITIRSG